MRIPTGVTLSRMDKRGVLRECIQQFQRQDMLNAGDVTELSYDLAIDADNE